MTTPASGYGAVDKVSKAGDTMTGTLTFSSAASPPITLPSGTAGYCLSSDGSGNLTLNQQNCNWVNVKTSYGAAGDGTTDDTTAIQDALNAIQSTHTVSVLYFPAGSYRITSGLTYAATGGRNYPIFIKGDAKPDFGTNTGGSGIWWDSPSSAITALTFTTGYSVGIMDFGIFSKTTVSNNLAGYVGIAFDGVGDVFMENVQIDAGSTPNHTVPVVLEGTQNVIINNSQFDGALHGIQVTTGCDGGLFLNSTFNAVEGNGGGAIEMDGESGSIRIQNCTTFGGDYGFLMQSSGGHNPEFVFIDDLEVNSAGIAGVGLLAGEQFFAQQLWLTNNNGSGALVHGMEIGSSYNGTVNVSNGNIGGFGGHGLWIQGGSGYSFTDVVFGQNGSNTANTYDDVHIASAASNISIKGCRFNVDPFNGFNANEVRSSLYIESGVSGIVVSDNVFAKTGYGTAAVIDLNPAKYGTNVHGPSYPVMAVTPSEQGSGTVTGTSITYHPASAVPVGSGIAVQVITASSGTVGVSDTANTYVHAVNKEIGTTGSYLHVFTCAPTTTALTTSSTFTITMGTSAASSSNALSVPGAVNAGAFTANGTGTAFSTTGTLISPFSMQFAFQANNSNITSFSTGPEAGWTFLLNNTFNSAQACTEFFGVSSMSAGAFAGAYASSIGWAGAIISFGIDIAHTAQGALIAATNPVALGKTAVAGATGTLSDAGHVHAATNGTGTLASGTVTVSNTAVTAISVILVTPTSNSSSSGVLAVITKTAGTSFVVKSSNASDANTFAYIIIG